MVVGIVNVDGVPVREAERHAHLTSFLGGLRRPGANPGQQTLRVFLNRFDVEKGWVRLAAETGFSEQTIEARLKSFTLIRNQCAHSASASITQRRAKTRDYCNLLRSISTGVVSILEKTPPATAIRRLDQQFASANRLLGGSARELSIR